MNDYTPLALNWLLFIFGTFVTLIPFIFRKKFGFFVYCFSFINTYIYSFNFLYYLFNGPITKYIFYAMLLHVTASGILYLSYLAISSRFSVSNQLFFNTPASLRDWKYLLWPAVLIFTFSVVTTKSSFNQILASGQDFVYNSTISSILFPFRVFIYAVVIKFILTDKRMGSRGALFLVFILLSELLRSFLSGSKAGVMGVLVFLSLIYFYKKSLNFKVAFLLILLVMPNIFFFIGMANIRNSIQRDNMWATMSMYEKAQYTYNESAGLDYYQALGNFLENIAKRFHGVTSLSTFLERTPAMYGYWGGTSYTNVLIGFIPRIMWPEKRMDDFGNIIAYNYFNINFTTNISPFVWGEPYLNFGVVGVLFFACFLGILFKLFEFILQKFSNNFFVQTFIVLEIYSYISTESNAARIIPGIISQTIFFVAFFVFMKIMRSSLKELALEK